jgi:hypothetical protein
MGGKVPWGLSIEPAMVPIFFCLAHVSEEYSGGEVEKEAIHTITGDLSADPRFIIHHPLLPNLA